MQDIFREHEVLVETEGPISFYHLCEKIQDPEGYTLKDYIFSPNGFDLGDDYIILVNGRNILALDGASTIFDNDVDISVFPKIGGG